MTFGKKLMKVIKSAECRDNRVLIQVMSKAKVERAIMKENKTKFKLAYSSLMLKDDMCVDLGLSGDGTLAKEILSGQRQLEESPNVQEIFHLFRNLKCDRILLIISVGQWIEHWKQAKERTALSYSELNFRHYKAHTLTTEIAEIKCNLVNLAIISR